VEITYIDPLTVVTRPSKTCKAFYLILVGTVSRYPHTKQVINYIKRLGANSKKNANMIVQTKVSFDEEMERLDLDD
jgi:hypothetical protein